MYFYSLRKHKLVCTSKVTCTKPTLHTQPFLDDACYERWWIYEKHKHVYGQSRGTPTKAHDLTLIYEMKNNHEEHLTPFIYIFYFL